jgi:hypothetical protein
MDNPVPSVMVYFDDRDHRGVVCIDDRSDRQREVEACTNSGDDGFHTHAWRPIGWLSDMVFMTHKPHAAGVISEFIRTALFTIVSIRDDFNRMQHERDAVREINNRLLKINRVLEGEFSKVIPLVESEKERRRLFSMAYDARQHLLTDGDDGKPS